MVSPILQQAILGLEAPDIVGSFREGQEIGRGMRVRELAGRALQEDGGEDLQELIGLDPVIGGQIMDQIGARSERDLNNFIRDAGIGRRLLESGNNQAALEFVNDRLRLLRRQGRDTVQTERIQQLIATGQTDQALAELTDFSTALEGAKDINRVQSSDILPDGTTITVFKDGTTNVTDPQGLELEGQARADAIRRAQEFGAQVQRTRAGERTAGTRISERQQQAIDKGLDASEGFANVARGLELLDRVETGGIDAVSLRAQQLFGVEGADEAELSNRLGKAVLSQLRATFGAAFTAKEGEQLARIEAGFGKSTEGNKRLLQQTQRLIERVAERGIRAAENAGDFEAADAIQNALDFRFTDFQPNGVQETQIQAAEGPSGAAVTAQQTDLSPEELAELEQLRANQ